MMSKSGWHCRKCLCMAPHWSSCVRSAQSPSVCLERSDSNKKAEIIINFLQYRSYSGHCNNVREPLWGAAYEPLGRLKPPVYEDGISFSNEIYSFICWPGIDQPRQQSRTTADAQPLPSARTISNQLLKGPSTENEQKHSCSLMLAQWAQFIYEDIARIGANRLFSGGEHTYPPVSYRIHVVDSREDATIPMPCCADQHPECLPIITEQDDQAYKCEGIYSGNQ